MREIRVFALLAALSLGLACSKDKTTAPEEPAETLLATATIGNTGGALTHDDFALTVPNGAWTGNASVKLYKIPTKNSAGDEIVTGMYKLTGIPEDFGLALHLRVRHDGDLDGEHFLAIGMPSYLPNIGDTATTYSLYPATDSSGYLIGDLPVLFGSDSLAGRTRLLKGLDADGLIMRILGASRYTRYDSPPKHFKFHFPLSLSARINDLANFFESAYDTLAAMGFTYSKPEGWHGVPLWPVTVSVSDGILTYDANVYPAPLINYANFFSRSPWAIPYLVDGDELGESANMPAFRRAAGREFTRFALAIHDVNLLAKDQPQTHPYDLYDKNFPVRFWWHNAMAVWCAGKFPNDGTYVPGELEGRETKPFTGLNKVSEATAREFGYGMSPLIEFLGRRYGSQPIVQVCLAMGKGVNPITPLLENVPESEAIWWPAFFREYLRGNIYGVGAGTLTKSANVAGEMDTDTDTLKEFASAYPDLSAKLYRVKLSETELSDKASISFEVDASQTNEDYVTVLVFREKDNSLELVGEGLSVNLSEVKNAASQGYNLIACVVNSSNEEPYTGSSNIGLTIAVHDAPQFNFAEIFLQMVTYRSWANGEVDTLSDWHQGYKGWGSFSGNVFTGSFFDSTEADWWYKGTVTITLDAAMQNVVDFSGTYRHMEGPGWPGERSMTGVGNIPMLGQEPGSVTWYGITGAGTLSHITSFEDQGTAGGSGSWELIGFSSDANSMIQIIFHEDFPGP